MPEVSVEKLRDELQRFIGGTAEWYSAHADVRLKGIITAIAVDTPAHVRITCSRVIKRVEPLVGKGSWRPWRSRGFSLRPILSRVHIGRTSIMMQEGALGLFRTLQLTLPDPDELEPELRNTDSVPATHEESYD